MGIKGRKTNNLLYKKKKPVRIWVDPEFAEAVNRTKMYYRKTLNKKVTAVQATRILSDKISNDGKNVVFVTRNRKKKVKLEV